MANVVVDYNAIVNLLREEMELERRKYPEFKDIKLVIEDERLLAKEKDRSSDTIYIQVKFGAASTNFGIASLPFSLEVLGINQDVELTQSLLNLFVNEYNRFQVGNYTQFFLTPVVSQNNLPIYEGFRSMFIISAQFIIGNNLVDIVLKYKVSDNEYEDVEFIAYNDSTGADLNPQPYSNNEAHTKSYGSFVTFAFTIVTYPDKTKKYIRDLMKWKYSKNSRANESFIFKFEFEEELNIEIEDKVFKCKGAEFTKRISEQPLLTATFTL